MDCAAGSEPPSLLGGLGMMRAGPEVQAEWGEGLPRALCWARPGGSSMVLFPRTQPPLKGWETMVRALKSPFCFPRLQE